MRNNPDPGVRKRDSALDLWIQTAKSFFLSVASLELQQATLLE
jgi:hypothetical protein